MDTLTVAVVGAIAGVVPTVIGVLTMRGVRQVDGSIAGLSVKVEQLTNQDTKILVELAELRVRVTQLEFDVRGRR